MNEPEDKKWNLCSMHDRSGRRGIWYRRTSNGGLEIRAGREGDDEHVVLDPAAIAADVIERLEHCLSVGAWMLDENGRRTHAYNDPCDDYPVQPSEHCRCQKCRPYPPYPPTKDKPTT